MRIELELEPRDEGDFEYDVWGGYEGQEDGEHFATFGRLEEAVAYKAEREEANRTLTLHIARRRLPR